MSNILQILSNIFIIFGAIIVLLGAINFLRSKNIFAGIHSIILTNIYGFSTLLIGYFLKNCNLQNLLKITIILAINLIIAIILQQVFNKRAILNRNNLKNLKICKTDL